MRKNRASPRAWRLGVALLFLMAAAFPALSADQAAKPHLAVFRPRNETGTEAMGAACSTAYRSLLLTLGQLGAYQIIPVDDPTIDAGADSLRAWAESHNVDYIVFGRIAEKGQNSLSCGISLYDRAKGMVTIDRESPPVQALDLLDAADDLIVAVASAATGKHLGFGELELVNEGEPGDYQVLVDGMDAGDRLASLGKLLAGKHEIVVTQTRMLGECQLARKTVNMGEGERLELRFSIPGLTPDEKAQLEGLEASIRAGWEKAEAPEAIQGMVDKYLSLTEGATYSASIAGYHPRAAQLAGEWILRKDRMAIEASAWDPSPSLIDPSVSLAMKAAEYPDAGAIAKSATGNALLLASCLELKAGFLLSKGDYAGAREALSGILDFSRCLPADRKSAYLSAASRLEDLTRGEKPDKDGIEAAFGAQMAAARRFQSIDASVRQDRENRILIPSDCAAELRIGGAEASYGPQVIPAQIGKIACSFRSLKNKGDAVIDPKAGARLIYLEAGAPSFQADITSRLSRTAGEPTNAEGKARSPQLGAEPGEQASAAVATFSKATVFFNNMEYRCQPFKGWMEFADAAAAIHAEDMELKKVCKSYKDSMAVARAIYFLGTGASLLGSTVSIIGSTSNSDSGLSQAGLTLGIVCLIPATVGGLIISSPPKKLIDYLNSHY